jgi:hypothetical protein
MRYFRLITSFLNNSDFLFECTNNLSGVYSCDTGIINWKYQYQNSILDKSDYFLSTQIVNNSIFCANFKNNQIIYSLFNPASPPNLTSLNPKLSTDLVNFDNSQHYIRDVFCTNPNSAESKIISLGSDSSLRISSSQSLNQQSSSSNSGTSNNDILAQMAGMYS